jgi:nicotinamidase/pyrazinamidase
MKAFFDIDTQNDFVEPGGALYGAGAERVIPWVAKLNRYAANHGITLISTMCAHHEGSREFGKWPPHCIVGTKGQQKPPETLVGDAKKQIIVEKDDLDMFSNPEVVPMLDRLAIDECYVYGVFLEYCVKCSVMGLLRTGRKVSIVAEATAHLNKAAGDQVIAEFQAAGGKCVPASTFI